MRDLYAEVTNKIIEQLEQGVAPWVRPWDSAAAHGGQPYNAISGKVYRGINVALLFAPQFPTAGWMTYKQAQDVGAHVRKGERGSMIVFFKPWTVRDANAEGESKEKTIPVLRCFTVFNVSQIENLPAKYQPAADERTELQRHEMAESLMVKANVQHGGDRAFYSASHDFIRLPQPAQFTDLGAYYATALHELTHWTGHASRLAREYGKRFGDQAYAREELVAEMGAAFLCGHCWISGKLQHAEYLQSWIKVLKADKRAILVAAGAAQKAADFIIGTKQEQSEEQAA